MDDKHLSFLLKGGTLNQDERAGLGIWPHRPIPISECVRVIRDDLDAMGFYSAPYRKTFLRFSSLKKDKVKVLIVGNGL